MIRLNECKQQRFASVWATVLAIATGQVLTMSASAETSPPSPSRNFNLAGTLPIVSATKSGTVQVGGSVGGNGVVSGGTPMSITAGQILTPAMNAALWQTTITGAQNLQINQAGAAVGGSATLNSSWAGNLSSLVVPAGVSVNAISYTTASPLNVTNVANILGSLHVLQSLPGMTAALNFGSDLNIGSGALLSGKLPGNSLPSNLNLPGLFASQNMIINVMGDLNNQGAINVAGTLSASVSGSINNISAAGAPQATIAAQNINLATGSGNLVNSGLVSALNTLNLTTLDPSVDLIISNAGGVLEATGALNPVSGLFESGALNIRADGLNLEDANVRILDGTLRSSGDINAFGRNVNVFVDRIDGRINIKGSAAHVGVSEGDLVIGNQILSGDPTYSSINGNIVIDGTFTTSAANPDLAVIAGGNITDTGAGLPFGLNSTNGGSVLLVAGVTGITANLVNDTASNLSFTTSPNLVTGGGSILFSGMLKNGINTSSAGAGGNVTLIALQGTNPTGGRIDLQSGGINTSGTGANNNGSVTIIANAPTGNTAIQNIGPITSSGTGAGNVTVSAANPINGVVTVKNGAITAGVIGVLSRTGGAVSVSDINAPGAVLVQSNGPVSVGNIGLSRNPNGVGVFSFNDKVSVGAVRSSGTIGIGTIGSTGVTLNGNITGVPGSGTGEVDVVTGFGGIAAASTSITTFGTVIVQADSGDVVIGDIDNSASTKLDPINVAASFGKTTVGSISSAGGAILLGNSFTASTGVVLNGDIDNRKSGTGAGVTIGTATGGISGAGHSIFSDGSILVAAQSPINSGAVSIGDLTNASGPGGVSVDSASGTISVGAITSSSSVQIGNFNSANGVTLNGNIVAGDNAGSGVSIFTLTGGIAGANSSISSTGFVVLTAKSLSNSGAVNIGAIDNSGGVGGVGIFSESGTIKSAGITTAGEVAIGSPASRGITLTGDINSAGNLGVLVRTGTGGISAAGVNISSAGFVSVSAEDSNNSGAVNIGVITNLAAGTSSVGIFSESGTISSGGVFSGGPVTIGSKTGTGVTLTGDILSASLGVLIRTGTGGISGAATNISSGNFVSVQALDTSHSGNVSIGTINNSGGSGSVSISAESGAVVSAGVFSAGDVTIGSKTGTGITLTGDIQSAGNSGVTVRTGTGGISALSASITAKGQVSVSAEDLNSSGAVRVGVINNSSGNQSVSVFSESGTVVSAGAYSTGNVTIGGKNGTGVTLTGNIESGGSSGVLVRTGTGGISAASASISAAGDVFVAAEDTSNSGLVSVGTINNVAGTGSVTIHSETGSVASAGVISSGNVIVGGMNETGVTLTGDIESAGSSGVTVRTASGGINAAGVNISAQGQVVVAAESLSNSGSVSIGKISNFSMAGDSVFVFAESGAVSSGGVFTAGDVTLGSSGTTAVTLTGDISSAGASGVTLRANTGPISAAGRNIAAAANVGLISDLGTVSIGGIKAVGNVTIGNAFGSSGITLTGDISSAGTSGVSIRTATGGIDGAKANITASAGPVTVSALDFTNSGAVSIGGIIASGTSIDVFINSETGTVSAGTIFATGNVSIGNNTGTSGVTLNGNINSSGASGVQILTATGGIAGTKSNISASAPVVLAATDLTNSGAVSIGSIINTGAASNVTVLSTSGTVSTGSIISSGNVALGSITGRGVTLTADISSAGAAGVQIKTATGGISGGNFAISSTGPVSLIASDLLNSGAVSIGTVTGTSSAADVTIDSASGTISTGKIFTLGLVNIGNLTNARGVTLNGDISSSGAGGVQIRTATGGISGAGASINAVGSVSLFAADNVLSSGAISIGGITTSGSKSDITINSQTGSVSAGQITSGGDISIGNNTGATGITLTGDISGAGSLTLQTVTGGIDGRNSKGQVLNDVVVVAEAFPVNSGNINMGPITTPGAVTIIAASGRVTSAGITAGGSITIGNSTGATGVTLTGAVSNAASSTADLVISTLSGGINSDSDIVAGGNLNISAASPVSLSGGTVAALNGNLSIVGQGTFGQNAILFDNISNGSIGASSALSMTANGGGNLRINAAVVAAESATFTANSVGTVTFNGGNMSVVDDLTFNGAAVNIGSFSDLSSSADCVVFNSDRVTIGPFATVSGITVEINGLTVDGTFAANKNMQLSNSGTIQATTGNIIVASALGQDLRISGDGSGRFISPVSSSVQFYTPANVSPTSMILGPGNQEFIAGNGASPGASVSFSSDTITLTSGVSYLFSNDYTQVSLNTKQLNGNPAQFVVHPNGGNPNSTITISSLGGGTIANSTGPVDLGFLDINFSGPLAVISATDIIATGLLTIRTSGTGANVTLLAGVDFIPTTTGTEGPDSVIRNITGITAGGSINLPIVDIQTDSFASGNILAVAASGTTPGSGAISLGSLSTGGSQGIGGNVRLIGTGVTVGAIDTRGPAGAGSVDIQSVTGVFVGGSVVGGTLQGSALGVGTNGAVSTSDINAGNSTVFLRGQGVSSSGTISANSLTLISSGSAAVGPLQTAVSNLNVSASSVDISNTGNLGLTASTSGKGGFTLLNDGNVTLASNLTASIGGPVNITLSSGTFANAGKLITSLGSDGVTITADDINLTGTTSILTFTANLQPFTPSNAIRIGSKVGSALSLSNAAINSVNSVRLNIGSSSTTGGITVASPITMSKFQIVSFLQGAVSGNAFTQNAAMTNTGADAVFEITATSGNILLGTVSTSDGSLSAKTDGASSTITLQAGLPVSESIGLNAGTGTIVGLAQAPAVLSPSRDASTGNGGSLLLRAANLPSLNLIVDVSGTGGGNGGTLTYINTATAALALSSSNLQVNASGNNAGNVTLASGGNLTINPTGMINATPTGTGSGNGNAGNLNFTAGVSAAGNLLVIGNLSANGAGTNGLGGNISLTSNSTTTFNIGATANSNINGIRGSLSVFGSGNDNGNISIANKGGGITHATQALTALNNLTFDTTGASNGRITISRAVGSSTSNLITITAGGTGTILPGGNVLTGATVNLKSNSGAITATVNTTNVSANTGGTAAVSITNQRAGLLTVKASSSGGNFTLRNTGANSGIKISGGIVSNNTSSGVVTLTATGTGSITGETGGSDFIQGRTVTLNTAATSTGIGTGTAKVDAVRVRAASIGLNTTGVINIDNLGLNAGLLTVTAARPASTFSLRSATDVRVNPALTNATAVLVDTSSGAGGITMQGAVGSSKTNTIDLKTGAGSITGNGLLFTNNSSTGVSLTTTTGAVGTPTAALRTNTSKLSILSPTNGLINVSDAFTGGISVNSALSSVGTLTYSGSSKTTFTGDISAAAGVSIKTTAGGASFTGNITGSQIAIATAGATDFAANKNVSATSGAISVTQNTGNMNIGAGAKFSATSTDGSAKITLLEKANVTGAGITIGDGAQLLTSAGAVKGGSSGQISIVIGSSVPAKVAGTQPANTNVDTSKAANPAVNKVYWGTNSAKVLTPGSNLNNLAIVGDTAIQFSAGTIAPITLAGNTQITADPPVGASTAPALILQSGTASFASSHRFVGSDAGKMPALPGSEAGRAMQIPGTAAFQVASKAPPMILTTAHPKVLEGGIQNNDAWHRPYNNINETSAIQITDGGQVYAPQEDTRIETAFGTIDIDAGSFAMVFSSADSVAIFNLDDMHRDAVRIQAADRKLSIAPGRHLLITKGSVKSFDEANPVESICYRKVNDVEVGAGFRGFSAEFSIPSAINAIRPLKQLLNSKTAQGMKLRSHLLKTVAAMLQMKPGSERFQQVLRPRVTAFNP